MSAKRRATLDLAKPYDIETEQQLLGELLMNNEQIERLFGFLEPHHFADPLHSRIYDAIARAARAGETASPFTLKAQFEDDEAMRALGGARYLAELAAMAVGCLDVVKWAAALHALAFRRNLIGVAREIQDAAQTAAIEYDAEKIAEFAERMMAEATAGSSPASSERFRSIGKLAADVIRDVTGPRPTPGLMFGLRALDELTGGMRAKELIIVGARPGMGKTAFGGHLALTGAQQGVAVAFFSMEMAAAAVTLRLAAATAFANGRAVAYDTARKGSLSADHATALIESEAWLSALPLYVHEGRGLTPSGLMLAAKRMQNKMRHTVTPLGLIVVDHIQKIRPERDMRGNKVAEMTEVSDALQKMAGTLDVPVVALSQLNRAVEGRVDRKPELSDLRESGAIEQDADLVLLLFREAYYVKKRDKAHLIPLSQSPDAKKPESAAPASGVGAQALIARAAAAMGTTLDQLTRKPAWMTFGDFYFELCRQGCDGERDVWPAIERVSARGRRVPDVPAYFRAAILEARDVRLAAAAPKAAGAVEWADRLVAFECEGVWSSKWGPKPGEAGCLAPGDQRSASSDQKSEIRDQKKAVR